MSKRINITLSDDFMVWLESESEKAGIPLATFATLLLNESKRNRELLGMSDAILLFMQSLTEDERKLLFTGKKKLDEFSSFNALPERLKAEFEKE